MKFHACLAALIVMSAGCSDKKIQPPVDNLTIEVISGDAQTAAPGSTLAAPLVVQVNRIGVQPAGIGPAEGVEVVWTPPGGGSVSPARSTTNAAGRTQTTWTLGPGDGAQFLAVRDAGGFADSVLFTATSLGAGCPATGGIEHAGVISTPETWGPGLHRVTGSVFIDAELTIQAGARVCVGPGLRLEFRNQGRLNAVGTPEDPIVFTAADTTQRWQGLRFRSVGFAPSFLNEARILFSDTGVFSESTVHPILIDRTLVRNSRGSALQLMSSGSEVTRSTFDGTTEGTAAVSLLIPNESGSIRFEATVRNAFAAGITAFGPSISITRTEVTGCGGDGVLVPPSSLPGSVKIESSNLFGNGGAGVNNLNTRQVDARSNWWGDPAGPSGPQGDGVSGNVDTSFSLSAPVSLGPRP